MGTKFRKARQTLEKLAVKVSLRDYHSFSYGTSIERRSSLEGEREEEEVSRRSHTDTTVLRHFQLREITPGY